MPRYIVSRLGMAVVMAVLATLVIFLIANTVPGDPVLAQLGDLAASNKEFVAEWRAKWGLDLPLWERYFIFLKGLLHGDLGISIASQRPVLQDIADLRTGDHRTGDGIGFLLVDRHRHSARHHRRGAARQLDRSRRAAALADRRVVADVLARLHRAGDLLRRTCRSRRDRTARRHRLSAAGASPACT